MNGETKQNNFSKTNTDCTEFDCPILSNNFKYLLETIERRDVFDFIDSLRKSNNGFYDLSKNKVSNNYINIRNDLIAFYTANGDGDHKSYEQLFEINGNILYLIDDIYNKLQKSEIIDIINQMMYNNYSIYDMRVFIIKLLNINFDNRKEINIYDDSVQRCEIKDVITPQYGQFLDLINVFYHEKYDIFQDSEIMQEIANYYFSRALESAGVKPYNWNMSINKYVINNIPFDRAINAYYLDIFPVAQGDVVDMGYLDLLSRSIKSTINIPNQYHKLTETVSDAAKNTSYAAKQIGDMSANMQSFILAFTERAKQLSDKIDNSIMITMIEVMLDFISDLHDLTAVPIGRWITYVSRILRCFIPNCVAIAIEFVNTYIAGIFTTAAQGLDDMLLVIVTALTGVIAIGSVPNKMQTNKMMEYMKAINTTVPFSKNILTIVQNIVKILPECIKGWFIQFVPEHLFYVKLTDEYKQVINDIDRFLTYDVDTIYFNSELQKQLNRTYVASHALVKDMAPFISDVSGEFSLLREQLRKFDKLYETVGGITKCGITKACPFSLTVFGDSQIGKSTLSAAIAKFMFPQFPADKVRYVIPADPDEFWNGYSALHPVTCEDDADQDAEYKNALQLFSIVTNAPYQPPMASLEDASIGKKGTPYHSKMHIRCTNVPYPNPSIKILTPVAYWKRRHMLVKAVVKDEFIVDGKVQYDPLFKHLEFYEYNPIQDECLGKIGDVMDFFDLLRSRYDRHMINEQRILQVMSATGEEFIQELEQNFGRDFYRDAVSQGKNALQFPYFPEFINFYELADAMKWYPEYTKFLQIKHPLITEAIKSNPILFLQCAIQCCEGKFSNNREWVDNLNRLFTIPDVDAPDYSRYRDAGNYVFPDYPNDEDFENPLDAEIFVGTYLTFLGEENFPLMNVVNRNYDRLSSAVRKLILKKPKNSKEFVELLTILFNEEFVEKPIFTQNLRDRMRDMTINTMNSVHGTYDKVMRYLELHPKISRILKVVGTVTALTSVIFSVFSIYSSIFKDKPIAEAIPSGDMRTAKYRRVAKRPAYAEGTTDLSAESLTHDVIRGRQAYINFYDEINSKKNAMCGLFIGGRYLLAPYHLFLDNNGNIYPNNTRMQIITDNVSYDEMFDSSKLKQLFTKSGAPKDVAVYECGKRVKLYKDIRHHFIIEDDLCNLNSWSDATINKYRDADHERQLINITPVTSKQYVIWNSEKYFTIYKGFQYDAVTVSGDCGSILMLYNTRIRGKLLGIHVAGDRNRHHGYSELITAEMLKEFNPQMQPANLPNLCDDEPLVTMSEGNYTFYGILPKELSVCPMARTEIKPSLISGSITQPVTRPSDLHRKHFGKAVSKYFSQSMCPNPKILPILFEDQKDIFSQLTRFNIGGCISEFEAINGNCKIPYFDRINMHTSPGVPYKLYNKKKGKHHLFTDPDEYGNYQVKDPILRTRIDTRIEMARKGQLIDSIWVDIPKDERRKPEKDTRMITIPPADYTIVFRKYFMDFIVTFYYNHLKFYSAVGMNPYSGDWTEMVNTLLKNSNQGGAGDHKTYDGKLMPELMALVVDVVNWYYGHIVHESNHEENALVRQVLFEELIHTRTQCCNVLYCTHGGNPTGNPFTVVLNTMINDMYFKMCWLMMAPDHLKSLKHFYENVVMFVYGDDNIKSISGNVASWYNEVTIRDHLKLYDLEYTNASKTGEMLPVEPIECLTFLKNGIRKDGVMYHALMDETTLYEMVNWIRDSDDDLSATIVNCNMALMMWYHYGKDRFEKERDRMLQALSIPCNKRSNIAHLLSYSYLDECYKDDRIPDIPKEDDVAVAQGKEDDVASGEQGEQNVKETDTVAASTTFIEQKPTTNVDRTDILKDDSMLMHGEWSIKRMLSRPTRIGTYAFTTTQTRGELIKRVEFPQIISKLPDNIAFIFKSFVFCRYKPVIRVQLNGNKFSAGKLILFAAPFDTDTGAASTTYKLPDNLAGVTAYDHVFLDASSNDVVTLSAPWLYPKEYYNYALLTRSNVDNYYTHKANSTFSLYMNTHNFVLAVFNSLNVGTGAPTTINATIWVHFEDVDLSIPAVSASTSQGGTHSYVTNNMQGWSKVANATLPTNVTGDAFDLNADLKVSTMDKPNYTLNPNFVVRRAMGYFSHANNVENLQRLCLYPGGVSTSNPSDFGTNYDEMDLKYLCGRYTSFAQFSIATTQTTGTNIVFYPLTPFIKPGTTVGGAPDIVTRNTNTWLAADAKYTLPLLSYVSLPFNFWGGSLKYRFDFVTNNFVTMKLAVCVIYGTASPDTLTAGIEPTSTLSYVFEVNGDNKTFEIEVPYVADTPWKKIMKGQFLNGAAAGLTTCKQEMDDLISYESCIGQIAVYVINPLSVPAGLPTQYACNVFIAGGADFRLNFISRSNTAWYPLSHGRVDPYPGTDLSHLGMSLMKNDLGCMSEIYTSVRDILKRYTHASTFVHNVDSNPDPMDPINTFSSTATINVCGLLMPFWAGYSANISNPSNIFNWYLALYRLWRGSIRVKIMYTLFTKGETATGYNDIRRAISVDYAPASTTFSLDEKRFFGLGTNDESSGAQSTLNTWRTLVNTTHFGPRDIADDNALFHEIEIPFVYMNRLAPVPTSGSGGLSGAPYDSLSSRANTHINLMNEFGTIYVNFPRGAFAYQATVRVFVAVGDDFRAGGLMSTPLINYGGIFTGNNPPVGPFYAIQPDHYN